MGRGITVGYSIITFELKERKEYGVHQNPNVSKQDGGWGSHENANVRIKLFSIKYLAHKVLAIITRFFVSFIKIPILLNSFMTEAVII